MVDLSIAMLNYQRVAGIQIPIMGNERLATLVRSLFVHPASGVLPGPEATKAVTSFSFLPKKTQNITTQ